MSEQKVQQKNPITVRDVTIIDSSKLRQAIAAASLGNAMEWFDFSVYSFVATILGQVFFPEFSATTQIVLTFALFSIPFIMRPLGGVFCGYLGDKYGRQKVLVTTVVIISLSTFTIGILPSAAQVGIWAPALLLLCKMIQGFSLGGEYTGAIIYVAEYAPDRKRGFMGSWVDFGSTMGFLLGAGLVALLTHIIGKEALATWGWRLPFFVALPLGLIGLVLRNRLEETPAFQNYVDQLEQDDKAVAKEEGTKRGPALMEVIRKYWRGFLCCIGLVISTNTVYHVLFSYMPTYLENKVGGLGLDPSFCSLIIIISMISMMVIQPGFGYLSDIIGRKPFVIFGSLALIFLSIPAFKLIDTRDPWFIFAGLLLLCLMLNAFTSIMASTLPAFYPTNIRYSALATSLNFSIVFVGMTPTVVAWLVKTFQGTSFDLLMPAFLLVAVGFIGLVTGISMRETANKPLRGDTPSASDIEEARELVKEHHDNIWEKIDNINEQIKELNAEKKRLLKLSPKKQRPN